MDVGSSSSSKSEINVTPLVDVCLVLLIIFMVITPVIVQETMIYLPKVEVTEELPDPTDPGTLVVKLNADGTVALRKGEIEDDVSVDQLAEKLGAELAARKDKSVFLDASTMVAYAQVSSIVDVMTGVKAVVAVVETDDNPDEEAGAPAGAPAAAPAVPAPSP